jgi:hypothetical protein
MLEKVTTLQRRYASDAMTMPVLQGSEAGAANEAFELGVED